jgi:hypothetical protein
MEKLDFLPCKAWIYNGDIYRAYFVNDECPESPREWDNTSVMVDFSRYHIGDENPRENCEEWLIRETGIDGNWYDSHRDSYGMDGLIKRFQREKCRAFSFLSIYDHSGISLYEGSGSGWDTSCIGFAYVPMSEKLTKEEAEKAISSEIKTYNMFLEGSVYDCIVEKLVNGEWKLSDALGGNYINNEKDAIEVISSYFSGKAELKDADDLLDEIDEKGLDVVAYGQTELFSA